MQSLLNQHDTYLIKYWELSLITEPLLSVLINNTTAYC